MPPGGPTPTPTQTVTPGQQAAPFNFQPTYITSTSATFAWVSQSGVEGYAPTDSYVVHITDPDGGGGQTVASTGLTATANGLTPNTEYTAYVVAVGSTSSDQRSNLISFTTQADGAPTPTRAPLNVPAPKNLRYTSRTATTVSLQWDDGGLAQPVPSTGYDVFTVGAGGALTLVGSANGTGKTITGLAPSTPYTFKVADQTVVGKQYSAPLTVTTFPSGNLTTTPPATPTPTPTPTLHVDPTPSPSPTPIEPGPAAFTIAGSATLKSLVKGTLPLSGSQTLRLNLSTGQFTGDLTLNQTTANLTALGFLPVTAKVNFVPTESVTGTYAAGALAATAKVRIKLPSITVFGAQLAGGASCQTTQVSTIPLKSTTTFSPYTGGTLAGTFSISNLAGCGALTGLVSPVTAGSGNSLLLKLTPQSQS